MIRPLYITVSTNTANREKERVKFPLSSTLNHYDYVMTRKGTLLVLRPARKSLPMSQSDAQHKGLGREFKLIRNI